MNNKKLELLANESVSKAIFKMSIPMIMGMMVQVFYNLADTFFIGRLGDPNQLAASNLALPVFMLLMAIGGIIGTGASSYISRCLGEKNYNECNKATTLAIILLGILGVLVTILGILFSGFISKSLGATSLTYDYTYTYVSIMFLGSIPIMCNYAFGQLLRSEGNAIQSMFGMLIGTVVNIVLDPILIFVFGLGITGAAIATVIGNFLGLAYYIYCFTNSKTLIKFKLNLFSFDKKVLSEIFKIGIPSSLNQMLMGVATIVANNIASSYGEINVAGMGIAMKIMTIGTFIFMGFAAGCQPLVGYSYGSKNMDRVKEVIKKGFLITFVVGLALAISFSLLSHSLIKLFINNSNVIREGEFILKALVISLPFIGGQMISTVSVQSMGKAKSALILSISRQGILYIPLLLILNSKFGFQGCVYSQPITDIIMIFLSIYTLTKILRKDKLLQEITN